MHNVSYEIVGANKLVITVDISARAITAAPPSSSGKTKLVASSGCTTPIAGPTGTNLSFALNVMAK